MFICFELGILPVLLFPVLKKRHKNKTSQMLGQLNVLAGFQLFWIVLFNCSMSEDSAFGVMHMKAQECLMFVIKYFQRT